MDKTIMDVTQPDPSMETKAGIAVGTPPYREKYTFRKYRKKPVQLFFAFFLPFIIMLAIYAVLGTFPFGKSSVLVLDLNGQYVYFFEALRNIVWGDGSLFYSFYRAMGGEFMGMYAYYLASPLSYIVALFPRYMMLEALYLMLILKCGLSGLTFCYYLYKNKITDNAAAQVIFSCMYALSAYGVVMQHNTMWFDCVLLLPLLALGIEQLIKYRKYKLFTITLALSVLSNFYIGYMVCLFVFFYFFFYYFSKERREINPLGEKAHFVRSITRVGIFSAIAVAISACILLPALYSLTFGKNDFSTPNFNPAQKFDFLDLLSKLYPGSYDTVRPEGWPLIYCGLPMVIFLPLFFVSKHIKTREKIASGVFILFFILCFNLTTTDLVWHGMQRPNWLNYRYSFMLCFFMVLLACKTFDRIRDINYKTVLAICGCAALLLFILQKMEYENIPDFACVWVSIGFLAIYCVAVPLVIKAKDLSTATMILCVFVCLELFTAGLLNLVALDEDVVISTYTSYHNFTDGIRPIVEDVQESDTSFYRMEKNAHRKLNDPMALYMRGFSNSTSTLNESTIRFLADMGLASKSHWTKYLGGNPVFDSLMGIKYLVAKKDDITVSDMYETALEDDKNGYIAYRNPYALPIAYTVSDDIRSVYFVNPNEADEDGNYKTEIAYTPFSSPFERMNAMITAMLGENETVEVFKAISDCDISTINAKEAFASGHKKYVTNDSSMSAMVMFHVNVPQKSQVYCYFPSQYTREVKLTLDGTDHGTYFGNETYRVMEVGKYEANDAFTLTMTLKSSDLYIQYKTDYFYYLDEAVFKDAMARLAAGGYQISDFTEDSFKGTITATEDQHTVFTTIPYDEGWQISVDGEKAEIYEVLDAVLAFDVTPGTHSIEMVYRSDAIVRGFTITAIGLAVFLLILLFEKKLALLYTRVMPKDHPISDAPRRRKILSPSKTGKKKTEVPSSDIADAETVGETVPEVPIESGVSDTSETSETSDPSDISETSDTLSNGENA